MQNHLVFFCLMLLLSGTSGCEGDVISDCDTYAASDRDPERKNVGVSFVKIDSSLAVPACEAAVRRYPNNSRSSHFNLVELTRRS